MSCPSDSSAPDVRGQQTRADPDPVGQPEAAPGPGSATLHTVEHLQ